MIYIKNTIKILRLIKYFNSLVTNLHLIVLHTRIFYKCLSFENISGISPAISSKSKAEAVDRLKMLLFSLCKALSSASQSYFFDKIGIS